MELTDSPYVYVFLPRALVSSLYHQKNVRFDSIPSLCFVTVSFFWAPKKTTTTLYNMLFFALFFFSTFEHLRFCTLSTFFMVGYHRAVKAHSELKYIKHRLKFKHLAS